MLSKAQKSPKSALTLGALALLIAQSVIAQTAPLNGGGAGANSNATPMIGLPNPDMQRGGAPYTPRDCSQAPDPGRCLARQQYMQNRQGGMGGGMQGQQGFGMGGMQGQQGGMPPGQGMGRPQGPGGMNGGMPGMGMGGVGGQGSQQGGMPGGQGHPPRDCSQAPDPGRCQARQQHMQNQQGGMPPGQGMGRPQGGMPPGQGMGGQQHPHHRPN